MQHEGENMNKLKIKTGIMASSAFHMAPVGVMGAIPLAIAHYSTSATSMQTIFALPTLTAVPMSLLIGAVAQKTGKKIPLQIGILAMLLSGLAVVLFDLPIAGLVIAMAIMGLGLGILMTLSLGLAADNFEGAEQSKVMAHVSAFANMGGMLITASGGFLLAFGWRQAFWIMILAVPVLVINQIMLPKEDVTQAENKSTGKIKLNADVYIFCIIVFFLGINFSLRNANAALLVVQHEIGYPAIANYAMTLWTAIGIIMGFTYAAIVKIIKQLMLPLSIAVFTFGMLLMGNATSIWVFYLGNVLGGIGVSTAMPTILSKSAQSVDSYSSTFVISMIFATLNISGFIAPALVNFIARIIASETAQVSFNIGAVSLALTCVFTIFRIYMQNYQKILDI